MKACAFRDRNGHSSRQDDLGRAPVSPVPCAYLVLIGVNTNKVSLATTVETASCVMSQIILSQSHNHLVAIYHHHCRGVSFVFLSDTGNSA